MIGAYDNHLDLMWTSKWDAYGRRNDAPVGMCPWCGEPVYEDHSFFWIGGRAVHTDCVREQDRYEEDEDAEEL